MKPVTVSVSVPRPREEVYAFLDVLANHEPFTDHMLTDWTLSGPRAGVGAKARMRANVPGPEDWIEMEVVEAQAPERIVERSVGAKGRRRTTGTYRLEALPDGGTQITFELVYDAAPAAERLVAPMVRAWLRRGNAKAMRRLAEQLSATPAPR